jgi:hypothetical protein
MKLPGEFDELELLELFWVEPTQTEPEAGYWCYEVTDELGATLKFGIDIIQSSIQLELKLDRESIGIFSFENAEEIEIFDYQKGQFCFEIDSRNSAMGTKVQIELRPKIQVKCVMLSLAAA